MSRGLVTNEPTRRRARPRRRKALIAGRVGAARSMWLRLVRAMVMFIAGTALVASTPAGGAESAQIQPAGESGVAPKSVPGPVRMENLAVITIEGEINAVTATSFKRRHDQAVEQGADGIVVEINSPGGELGAVLEICTEIKRSPVYTIAWINTEAYSGGAIIALACDEIVLATGATMGDAAPIAFDPTQGVASLSSTEREKLLVPLISELVDSAVRNGYDEVLVIAFAQLGVETWLVERASDGQRFFLSEREYIDLFDQEPPRGRVMVPSAQSVVSSQSESHDPALDDSVEAPPGEDPDFGADSWERATSGILGEETKQALRQSQFASQSLRPDFRQEEPDDYRYVGYATDGKTLLTLKANQLRAFGFTDYDQAVDSDEQLKAYVGAQNLARLDQTWSESLVGFMTQGVSGYIVRSLLIVVFLLAMFLELTMPGVGLAGTVALIALAALIVPPMMIGASTWWALAAIVVGVGMLLLEVLVFPGFGIPGVGGLLLLMVGLVGTFAQPGELFPGSGPGGQSDLAWAVSTVLLALFAAGVGMFFLTKYTRSIPIANRLVLFDRQPATDTADSHPGMLAAMADPDAPVSVAGVCVGDSGVAHTRLNPSGTAEINDRLRDVVSEFGYVEANTPIRVVNVTEYRIGVEPIRASDATAHREHPEHRA